MFLYKEERMRLVDINKFDSQKFHTLTHKINNVKNDVELNPAECEKGGRFHNNERIARIVLGYIFEEVEKESGDAIEFLNAYSIANMRFLSLDHKGIMPYIKKAVEESARADYYYANEKDWGQNELE